MHRAGEWQFEGDAMKVDGGYVLKPEARPVHAGMSEAKCFKCGFLLVDGACANDDCSAFGPGGQP